jgi:hypothetical protein
VHRSTHPRVGGPDRHHAKVLGACGALLATAGAPVWVLAVLTPGTVTAATASGADESALVAAVAIALAWVVAARLAIAAVAAAVAVLPGAVGAVAGRVAGAATPAMLKSLVGAAVGVWVLGGPVAPCFAAVADNGPGPGAARLPVLDRLIDNRPGNADSQSASCWPPRSDAARHAPARLVVVRSGDTLWGIAASRLPADHRTGDIARSWPRWFAENRAAIGPDPGVIHSGLALRPPP